MYVMIMQTMTLTLNDDNTDFHILWLPLPIGLDGSVRFTLRPN